MGQKVHPIGFRIGITKDWKAKWYAEKQYTDLFLEDLKIRSAISSKYAVDDISNIEIERSTNLVTVTIHTARPGIVIGRGGQRVDEMRTALERIAGKRVKLNIIEVAQPELDAYLVARSIAQQIERRISHRRAMKQAIARAMERGAQGIKITCAGRISGSEYARKEKLHQGRVPLHTLRADIDYALAEAHTTLGRIGVKVWVYKGDIIPESEKLPVESSLLMTHAEEKDKTSEAAATVGSDEAIVDVAEPSADISMEISDSGDEEKISVEDAQEISSGADIKDVVTMSKGTEPSPKTKIKGEVKQKPVKKVKSEGKLESDVASRVRTESKPKTKSKAKKPEIGSKSSKKDRKETTTDSKPVSKAKVSKKSNDKSSEEE